MRTKGFSLVELLTVGLLIALIATLISVAVIGEIDSARGSTLTSEARIAYIAATAVMLEFRGADIEVTDEEFMAGLTGTAGHTARPVEIRLSERMNAMLAHGVTLGEEPGEGVAAVSFVIEKGELAGMTYRSAVDGRYYAVTIANGETSVERENPPGE